MTALFLAVAIVSEVIATLSLKASEGFTRKRFLVPLIGGYLVAFVFLSFALDRGLAIGVAYGVWAAAGIALAAVASKFLFAEPLTKMMASGIALIAAGVLIVELGGH